MSSLTFEERRDLLGSNWQIAYFNDGHDYIAQTYVTSIADVLQEYGQFKGYTMGKQFYEDLAWGGLQGTNAFNSLSSTAKNRILDLIAIELTGKDRYGNYRMQKGTNAGVKKNLLIFLFFLLGWSGYTQSITGKFQRTDPATAARDIGVQFFFKKNFKFEKIEFKHLETQEKSHGSYLIVNDTLILHYEKYQKPYGNVVEITEKKKIKSNSDAAPLYTLIQAFEKPGKPKPGVIMVIRNKDKETVMAFMSDSEGFFPNLSIYDNYLGDFQISALGKQETIIGTDSLFGFRTNITILFENSSKTKISKEATEKFLIKEMTDREIELLSLEEQELILLKKLNSN